MGSLIAGYPLPILATQIIWLNFVTDGFLDVSLAMEPKEKGLLQEKPRGENLIDWAMAFRMILMSIPMMLGTLFLFKYYYPFGIIKAWTVTLTTLSVFQWFNAWNCRHEKKSIFGLSPFSNTYLIAATMLVIALQLFAVYAPIMQKLLKTTALSASDWMLIIVVSSSIILIEEGRKFIAYIYRTIAK